jgi:hypothetical protein
MNAKFDLSFVSVGRDVAEDIQAINSNIERLTKRRLSRIEVTGHLAQSKLAWKIVTYQQATVYRVVAAARGTRDSWNARNVLLAFLGARALIETLALFDDFELELVRAFEREDIRAMDQLVMHWTFSTRDKALLDGHPELLAKNVLTLIDKMGKRYGLPISNNYDFLSEHCHPNSAGNHQLYSTTDTTNGTVTYSELKKPEMVLSVIRPSLGLLALFERTLVKLDRLAPEIAEWHRQKFPVGTRNV